MLENKDYCDYELRLGLKDIGYPMSTCQINDGPIQMPKITLYEAQKFLREEWGIHITIHYVYHLNEHVFGTTLRFMGKTLRDSGALYDTTKYSTHEEALSEGIKTAIKFLKEE